MAQSVSQLFNKSLSQGAISRFESNVLPAKNMSNLMPLLHVWLEESNPDIPIIYFIPTEDVEKVRNKRFQLRKTPTTLNKVQRYELAKILSHTRSPTELILILILLLGNLIDRDKLQLIIRPTNKTK